jgi:hypothetical protein
MNYLIKQIQDHCDLTTLERGWEHFHRGAILDLKLQEMIVYASLKGGGSYEVKLNLEQFSRSQCTCQNQGICIHIASIFFRLYVPYGRPELLMQQLKQVIYVRQKTLSTSLKPADTPTKTSPPSKLSADMMPSEWHRFFETKFYGFSISHQNSLESFYQSVYDTLPGFAASWPKDIKWVYELHLILFVFRKIEQFFVETKNSYLSEFHENNCKQTVHTCMQSYITHFTQCKPTMFLSHQTHWQATLEMIGDICLVGKVSPVDWISIYRLIWWYTPVSSHWHEKETARLDKLIQHTTSASRKKDYLLMARAHFDLLLGSPEDATSRLQAMQHLQAVEFYFYLELFSQLKRWSDLLFWLRWLLPLVSKTNHEDFRKYCQYWLQVTEYLPSDLEWVEVMEHLLPRSYYYYTSYLLKTKRYQQWVDLQLSNRISPLSLYAVELQAIEEYDCRLLLPLYHQATERAILEKNRNAYKIALRLLKKMEEYYAALQQQHQWKFYIEQLADKFSRLRAFQEELQRGKWIE